MYLSTRYNTSVETQGKSEYPTGANFDGRTDMDSDYTNQSASLLPSCQRRLLTFRVSKAVEYQG